MGNLNFNKLKYVNIFDSNRSYQEWQMAHFNLYQIYNKITKLDQN